MRGLEIKIHKNDKFRNRGKKAVLLSLKDPMHLQAVKKLIKSTDVLIDPYRPGVMEKLGLGPKECLEINPKLIYARLSGYGQTGEYSLKAGHDLNYLSLSG
jgi:alpha-methylacyl-CoA racemase